MLSRTLRTLVIGAMFPAAAAACGSPDGAPDGFEAYEGQASGAGGGALVYDAASFAGNGTGGPGSDASCASLSVNMTRQTPTVLLLIDQSLSMDEPFGGGTRWTVVRDALLDPATGLVKKLEQEIRFGLALYTSLDGLQKGGTCPMLVEVQCSVGNYPAIQAAWNGAAPIDDTPTAESIMAVTAKLVALKEPGPKYIVLATDGAPDMCEVPDDLTATQKSEAKSRSVKAVQGAYAKGIGTSVLAIGPGVGASHLQELANAGQGLAVKGNTNAKFFEALNQEALSKAFTAILEGARSCKFTLEGEVVPGGAAGGTVALDGQPLPYGAEDGWTLSSPSELELLGASCKKVQSGEHQLSATFPCGAVVMPK
jgi:hypothetical protein